MSRIPRIPKGLKSSLAREKRLSERKKKIDARKALIKKMQSERDSLRKRRRGY